MDAQTHFLLDYDGGSPRESTPFIACVACRALRKHRIVASLVGAMLFSPASTGSAEKPLKHAGSQLEPIKWTERAGWSAGTTHEPIMMR
jgi:hypothetical protein